MFKTRDHGGEDSTSDRIHQLIEARDQHSLRREAAEEAGSSVAGIHAATEAWCQDLADDVIRRGKSG
ncbi:hypothetical protein [Streptomyces sp. NPDC017941]|uniref:hypothetical protein n=1 Tax=Streptomyces sp. NPDC017941 TaxID=3365018 RepID=UPI0037B171CF